jgi:hypothetical protein
MGGCLRAKAPDADPSRLFDTLDCCAGDGLEKVINQSFLYAAWLQTYMSMPPLLLAPLPFMPLLTFTLNFTNK